MQAHKWDSNKVILLTHTVGLVGMVIGECAVHIRTSPVSDGHDFLHRGSALSQIRRRRLRNLPGIHF